MEQINIAIVTTTLCDLKCSYCVNNQGTDLVIKNSGCCKNNEWHSADDLVSVIKKISRIRDIQFIKFFGGEPLIKKNLVIEVIKRVKEISNMTKFAFTTNAYQEWSDELVDFFVKNRVIINISLDGPEDLNNNSRIPRDGGNCYQKVMENIHKLKRLGYPFALISVLDKRIVDYNFSLIELSKYLQGITPIYKIEPAYEIATSLHLEEYENILLNQLDDFVKEVFKSICSLNETKYIYENNVFRTICNVLNDNTKAYVCTASSLVALFPNLMSYACYNLDEEKYKIADNMLLITEEDLNNNLNNVKELLKIENFPSEYKDVEFFGDYCPKDNNFSSFAYKYRKRLVDTVKFELSNFRIGSKEHLSLLNYMLTGISSQKNIIEEI